MDPVSQERTSRNAAVPWGSLPPRLRVLYIACSQRTGAWLADAFAADRAAEVELDEAVGSTAGLARLREEVYDAVFVSHAPGELDALELVAGMRAGGADEPAIVLGSAPEDELAALCYEAGADGYLCVESATTRTLLWVAARAVERQQLIRENRRLVQAERNRLRLEHGEAERLLDQQRTLIRELEQLRLSSLGAESITEPADAVVVPSRPDSGEPAGMQSFACRYRELLRAYVIMGSGNLAAEMSAFADSLAAAGISAPQSVAMHVRVLEELVRGLGNRSARHVMTRADLLALEVIVHLAERYRLKLDACERQPEQKPLPGFDEGFGLVA